MIWVHGPIFLSKILIVGKCNISRVNITAPPLNLWWGADSLALTPLPKLDLKGQNRTEQNRTKPRGEGTCTSLMCCVFHSIQQFNNNRAFFLAVDENKVFLFFLRWRWSMIGGLSSSTLQFRSSSTTTTVTTLKTTTLNTNTLFPTSSLSLRYPVFAIYAYCAKRHEMVTLNVNSIRMYYHVMLLYIIWLHPFSLFFHYREIGFQLSTIN